MANASLVVTNAAVWTGTGPVARRQAIAVRGDRILAVGGMAEVAPFIGVTTKLIDAAGSLVLPGFNDSHAHLLIGGYQLMSVDLRGARSGDELAALIAARAQKLPPEKWLIGGNWDDGAWPGRRLPMKEDIDPYTPSTPVFVTRSDLHMGLANSAALSLAGITAATPDPPGGAIMRRPESGEPTGILKDAALDLVRRVIPPPSQDDSLAAIAKACEVAASLGVTSLQDMAVGEAWENWRLLQAFRERRAMTVRLCIRMPLADWIESGQEPEGMQDEWLKLGGVKGFVDGSLGSATALFFAPYDDEPDNRGLLVRKPVELADELAAADRAGLQAAVHAIGDRANSILLDVYAAVAARNGERDRRFRIEHAQHLVAADIARMASMGVIAAVQPSHVVDDGRWAERRIGAERAKFAYPFRSLLDAGVVLAFGSDWPVASLSPLAGIQAAVTRRLGAGYPRDGWHPEQRIGVDEAIRAYTAAAAYAEFAEADKGVLAPGKLADFVVLSRNIFAVPPEEIAATEVLCTICGGKVVYER